MLIKHPPTTAAVLQRNYCAKTRLYLSDCQLLPAKENNPKHQRRRFSGMGNSLSKFFSGAIIFGSDQEVAGVMRAVRRNNATGAFSWIGSDGWSARNLVSDGNEPEVSFGSNLHGHFSFLLFRFGGANKRVIKIMFRLSPDANRSKERYPCSHKRIR